MELQLTLKKENKMKLIMFFKNFTHDVLGWHNGDGSGKKFFDGLSHHATCSKCGKEVMLDSQGNWF